jgi:hypothetical protein
MVGWHVARIGEARNAYRILVEKRNGKHPFGKQRRRWWLTLILISVR